MRFVIILAILAIIPLASCVSNLKGAASIPLVCKDVCGDGTCGPCETCSSCMADCCTDTCDDSDGGNNAIQRGIISGSFGAKQFRYEDMCTSPEVLQEYTCGGQERTSPTNIRYACTNLGKGYRCEGGECTP